MLRISLFDLLFRKPPNKYFFRHYEGMILERLEHLDPWMVDVATALERHEQPQTLELRKVTDDQDIVSSVVDLGLRRRRLVQVGGPRGDDEIPLAGQQALVDPAAGPLPVAD